jgi:hypothetical protein
MKKWGVENDMTGQCTEWSLLGFKLLLLLGLLSPVLAAGYEKQKEGTPSSPVASSVISEEPPKKKKEAPSKRLEFDELAINAFDPKFDSLSSDELVREKRRGMRIFSPRKDFKSEQRDLIKNWGVTQ